MTDDISKVDYDELHVTHSAGEIAEMLRQSDAQCATLARQLAEATDRRDCWERLWNKADARADAQEARAEQAESALAAATRRVAEVEGLVGKWRHEASGQSGYWVDALRDCADELEALTKEPTK